MAALAFALSFLAALASYRWSRLCAAAFAIAFAASALYLGLAHLAPLHHAAGELEPLRLVSVVTGSLGAVELAWRASMRAKTPPRISVGPLMRVALRLRQSVVGLHVHAPAWREQWAPGRPDAIASLLVASSLVDLASWLWWRETGQWGPLPAVSCLLYVGVIVVGIRRGRA